MKVVILQEQLFRGLSTAARIVSTKAQMPVLSHVLLRAEVSGLVVEATNLELGMRIQLGAKVEEQGSLTVPMRTFLELVSNLSPGKVELSADGAALSITNQGVKATVNGMSSEEFPVLPEFDEKTGIALPAESLKSAIDRVAFAAAVDESRPVLTAIWLQWKGKQLSLVGTDGFRLSKVVWSVEQAAEKEQEWLVPAKGMVELSRLIEPLDEQQSAVKMATLEEGNQLVFSLGDVELSTRLISGKFPDVNKIIPEASSTVVEMDREELLRAMRLAAVFAKESANIVKLEIGSDSLQVAANAPQVGGEQVVVEAVVSGEPMPIAFNYRYVLDWLGVVRTERVQLSGSGSLAPGRWMEVQSAKRKEKKEGMEFIHVIMPVRLQEGE